MKYALLALPYWHPSLPKAKKRETSSLCPFQQRSLALAMLEIEQQMQRISGYKALPKLRKALQASIRRKQEVLNEEPLAE